MNTLNPISQAIASQGRYGDSTLVHMHPQEVAGLQALARRHGTTMTVNPQTGLPEAFNLKSLLPMIAGIALGPAGLGLSSLQAGMLTGAATGLITKDPMQALMAGFGGYGGAGIGGGLGAAGAAAGAPGATGNLAAQQAAMGNLGAGQSFYGAELAGQLNPAQIAAGQTTASFGAPGFGQNLSQMGAGLESIFSGGPTGEAARSAFMGSPAVAADAAKGIAASPATGVGGGMGLAKYGTSALSPMLMGDEGEIQKRESFMRPYDLEIENLSGTYDPLESSREREQLRYKFIPKEPIRLASGGTIGYQEGGDVSGGSSLTVGGPSTPSNLTITASPPPSESSFPFPMSASAANVFRNIGNIRSLAGLPTSRDIQFQATPQISPPTESTPSFMLPPQRTNVANLPNPQGTTSFTPAPSSVLPNVNAPRFDNLPKNTNQSTSFFKKFGSNPDYQEYTPKGDINMSNYVYDPVLGGFKERIEEYSAAQGGLATNKGFKRFQEGGLASMMNDVEAATPPMEPRFLRGDGDGMSDEILATIDGEQDALLSDGEFVIPADVVSHLGNGSSEAGAKVLYAMMDRIRKARTGNEDQAEEIDVEEFLPR